jgi:2-hydroxy-6-oxonona-2,4-dienedioate hydrolase/2-hydroxy-6-oxo-6-(2'-carboxyphenyl)-hexa-2,4-dienoate hydrolase
MSFWTDALGAEVRYHDAGGWRTRVVEAGRGEPVIMMHGLSGHAESFIRNVVPLAQAGFRAISMDAIGHGYSVKPLDATYHSPLFVEHLKRFMDAIGARKAHLVGQSLGGWTAMNFAQKYPDRVRSIISVTGAGILLEDEASKKKSEDIHKQVQTVTQNALQAPTREGVRKRLEWLMLDPKSVTDELVETRYTIFMLPDSRQAMPKMVQEQPGEGNRAHLMREKDLAALSVPTYVVWTDHNPTMPASIAERAAKLIPGAKYSLVEGAGHWPQFEKPEVTNKLLIDFLKQVGS